MGQLLEQVMRGDIPAATPHNNAVARILAGQLTAIETALSAVGCPVPKQPPTPEGVVKEYWSRMQVLGLRTLASDPDPALVAGWSLDAALQAAVQTDPVEKLRYVASAYRWYWLLCQLAHGYYDYGWVGAWPAPDGERLAWSLRP